MSENNDKNQSNNLFNEYMESLSAGVKQDLQELQFLRDERTLYWPLLKDLKKFNIDKALVTEAADRVRAELREISDLREYKEKADKYDQIRDKLRDIFSSVIGEDW